MKRTNSNQQNQALPQNQGQNECQIISWYHDCHGKPTRNDQPPLSDELKSQKEEREKKNVVLRKIKRLSALVFLFPKILIPSFHMWCLDLSPAAEAICYGGLQAAGPTAHGGERSASRRRSRASPVMQPDTEGWTKLPGASQPLRSASERSYAVIARPAGGQRAHTVITLHTHTHTPKKRDGKNKSSRYQQERGVI